MCKKCKSNESISHEKVEVSRRKTIKQLFFGSLALLVPLSLTSQEAKAGNGSCYLCSCPEYVDGYNRICANCGHSWNDHTIGGY